MRIRAGRMENRVNSGDKPEMVRNQRSASGVAAMAASPTDVARPPEATGSAAVCSPLPMSAMVASWYTAQAPGR
jgi:hypothetical protein